MIELEEKWGDGGESRDESDDIFPRLKLLNLIYCPKLESLPKGLLGPNKKLRAGIELDCVEVAFDKNIYL
ncbi:hypothetical protein QJS04_geneDACA007963 [Acorus gramineus]|uniref:Uncharacterized protein n=1 Tax=Acorus gramineus TaxID=55184 RepID=A0AAV9B8P4_ACOGR|nr:hypothetical protein QJS04_geneDACA007963 [Acorus gramineus]